MGCCGQSRAEYRAPDEVRTLPRAAAPAAPAAAAGPAAAAATPGGSVRLRFTRQSRVRVRGPASGADYVFSGSDPVHAVDAGDVDGLLRTGYFRRAY